jgi:intein/homing endonuclease/type IV secretory pathway ATPase VirB11/archaellum biosynthesis ATPase
MLFRKDTPLYAYEIVREGGADVMYINYLGASFIPRLADSPEVMAKTVDALIENPNISKIVFVQQRNYVYDSAEVFMLVEIAQIYSHLINQEKILTPSRLVLDCRQCLGNKYNNMAYFSFTLKRDPILAYHELKKFWREEKVVLEKTPPEFQVYELNYLRLLEKMISLLENTRLIREAISEAEERKYTLGSRGIYQKLFQPDIVPNFTFTRLVADLPEDAEIVEQYEIASGPDKSIITILKRKGEPKYLYHILPPEYTLEEDYQMLLNLARNVMIEHQPKAEEFLDFERTRRVFSNIARDLIQDLANTNKIPLNYSQLEVLANILVRHTIGFGVIEVLLQDERLQDIALNAPIPLNPIFVRHGVYDECETNIIPSQEDAESWAAKFRMLSGRPLDEASPILDTELAIKNFRARVAIIQQPLSPNGLAYAFRRHREKPWTLPLFIDTKMINPFTAGLMSFFIEGARTLLVAGTRSAGKCVKGDTLIQLANGDIKTIKELEHGKQEKISDGYIFYPNPKINVLSLDNNFKVNEKTVNAFWRRESPKELIKLTTNSGKEVITTKEHPYFIFDDKFRAVNAGDLKQEDFIATPRKIDINGREILIPEAKEMITELRTNAKKISFPEKIDEELAEFLGYLIGDGHLDEHKIEFTNSDISLRTRFTEIAKKLFSVSSREIKDRNTWNVQITSRVLNRALNKLFEIPFGDKASSIRIPSKILKSNNKILAAFLRAYFDCDSSVNKGSASNEKREIEIATASSLMSRELQIALLRFGIISFLKTKNVKGNRYYRIFIRGEFFKDFAEKVGFNHPDKIKQANKLTGRKWIDNTNIDVIPNGNSILRELRKGLRVRPFQIRETTGKDYWAYENNAYNVSRKWFRILVEAYETRFKELIDSKRKIETLNINSSIEIFEYFRELLNIKNEEFAEKISLATVTNFFSEVYKPRCETCKAIIDKIKEIYDKTVSKETEKLVMGSKQLAYSDIFWDRVKSVEKIKAEEEWVYDFTVEPFQNFVANGFFAHNTSLLGSLMLEIMPKYRIITVEDSVTGDCRIIVKENGKIRKTTIGNFIDEEIKENGFKDVDGREKELNSSKVEVLSVDKNGKVVWAKPSKFIRHKANKQIYEIITASGKNIKVTEDHSLFGLDEKNILKPVRASEIKENDFIAIPCRLPFNNLNNSFESIDSLEHLDSLGNVFIEGESIRKYVFENKKELFALAYLQDYKKSTIQNWIKKGILPARIFEKIKNKIDREDLFVRLGHSKKTKKISCKLELDETFLNFVGLWLADGCYDKRSVIVSVQEGENKQLVRKIAKRFEIPLKTHSDKFSSILNSSLLKSIMQDILELNGNSYTKKIPSWAYNLSDKQTGWLLKGFFSGDGCASDKEVVFSSCSEELVKDISSLLLRFGIVLMISNKRESDKTIPCRIGSVKMLEKFKENIGFLVNKKQKNLEKLTARVSSHDSSDVIPLSLEVKEELSEIFGKEFSRMDYITRGSNLGREHLTNLLNFVPKSITNPIEPLKKIVKADIFWDKVKKIVKVDNKGYVYDISVPECENFVCENILAHNTLELAVDSMRELGYDIQRMKVRSALLKTSAEVAADEGIRTSLRLGDSCLIIGEVRSEEALALYESMRIGALANVVAGTIHGGSPYAVFDRVVNDLKVPITSFKATDLIIVANPIKSPSGGRAFRRVTSLSEVRKEWKTDPLDERGFVDLLKYNVEKDELEPTADLINGDSETIKSIASGVKGWAGNWDAVYDNILLRGKVKEEIVKIAKETGHRELLEAKFNCLANAIFYEISEKVRQEIGLPLGERVFPEWQKTIKEEARKFIRKQ